ncbi:hypothetical protein EW145_g5103, partial [Phellinidium pouzarii]
EEEEEEEEEEIKALSHKEQRRLKKKQKLLEDAETSDVDGDALSSSHSGNKPRGKKLKAEERKKKDRDVLPKRQNSIWVGNLSFKTSPDTLRAFFDGVGEITRVHMPTKINAREGEKSFKNENQGFAYVDFVTPDAKAIAVTMSERNLDGRRLLIKDGSDFSGRPVSAAASADVNGEANVIANTGLSKTAHKILRSQKQPAGPCLFLGNLGFETTESSIREMIEGHAQAWALVHSAKRKLKKERGEEKEDDLLESKERESKISIEEEKEVKVDVGIKKVRMGTFEDSGLCKGFAFVDFTSTAHATAALTNPRNRFLDGRKLAVEYASPEAARRGGHRVKGTGGGNPSRKPAESGERRTRQKKREHQEANGDDVGDGNTQVGNETAAPSPLTKERRPEKDDRNAKPYHKRTKPGAALALAQREKYAIVPSEGTKLTFT